MQQLRKVKSPVSFREENEDEILHFSLQGLIPQGQILALNTTLGTLSLLANKHDLPQMVFQQQFTTSEIYVLMPLLEAYPYYCPYEILLASFNGCVNDVTVARCHQRLQDAAEAGIWDHEMRPVRNVLSRTRLKTRTLGLEISSILETGYILMGISQHMRRSGIS